MVVGFRAFCLRWVSVRDLCAIAIDHSLCLMLSNISSRRCRRFSVVMASATSLMWVGALNASEPVFGRSPNNPTSAGVVSADPSVNPGMPSDRWIVDVAGVLDQDSLNALARRLSFFAAVHGAQVAVLIVQTTGSTPLNDYAHRVASGSGLGREGINDGLLVLLAVDDRRIRIEVGAGLKSRITDDVAAAIIDEAMVPRLRQGDYAGGINAGLDRIFEEIAAIALPPPRR